MMKFANLWALPTSKAAQRATILSLWRYFSRFRLPKIGLILPFSFTYLWETILRASLSNRLLIKEREITHCKN